MPGYSDPVAEGASDFLRTYTSRHPETLVVYAKWYGKVSELITSAGITNIDRKGMTLKCTLKAGGEKYVHVPIKPSLKNHGDIKPRLLVMKALAEEGLGIIKPPQVTKFYFPLIAFFTISSPIFIALGVYSPELVPRPISAFLSLGGLLEPYMKQILYFGVFLHVPEAMYAAHLSRKHQMRRSLMIAYTITTFIFGVTIWLNLKREVRALRVKSVMKAE